MAFAKKETMTNVIPGVEVGIAAFECLVNQGVALGRVFHVTINNADGGDGLRKRKVVWVSQTTLQGVLIDYSETPLRRRNKTRTNATSAVSNECLRP